jgi:hypothetical protein
MIQEAFTLEPVLRVPLGMHLEQHDLERFRPDPLVEEGPHPIY